MTNSIGVYIIPPKFSRNEIDRNSCLLLKEGTAKNGNVEVRAAG